MVLGFTGRTPWGGRRGTMTTSMTMKTRSLLVIIACLLLVQARCVEGGVGETDVSDLSADQDNVVLSDNFPDRTVTSQIRAHHTQHGMDSGNRESQVENTLGSQQHAGDQKQTDQDPRVTVLSQENTESGPPRQKPVNEASETIQQPASGTKHVIGEENESQESSKHTQLTVYPSNGEAVLYRQKRIAKNAVDTEPKLSQQTEGDTNNSGNKMTSAQTGVHNFLKPRVSAHNSENAKDTKPGQAEQKGMTEDVESNIPVRVDTVAPNTIPSKQESVVENSHTALMEGMTKTPTLLALVLLRSPKSSLEGGESSQETRTIPEYKAPPSPAHAKSELDVMYPTISRPQRQLLATKDAAIEVDSILSSLTTQEAELLERQKREPEHKLYNEDLLLRRMKLLRSESKTRSKRKVPEDENSWDHEFRIRDELAEKAIEYGIQKRKERTESPMSGRELSIVQRIRQDAEEILKRRADEQKYAMKYVQDRTYTHVDSSENEGQDELQDEEKDNKREREKQGKKEKKKNDKAIRKLLNLKQKFPKETKTLKVENAQEPTEKRNSQTDKTPETTAVQSVPNPRQDNAGTVTTTEDSLLKFDHFFSKKKGKMNRKKRKQVKKRNKTLSRAAHKKQGVVLFKNYPLPPLNINVG